MRDLWIGMVVMKQNLIPPSLPNADSVLNKSILVDKDEGQLSDIDAVLMEQLMEGENDPIQLLEGKK